MSSSLHPPKDFLPRRHLISPDEVHPLNSIAIGPLAESVRRSVFPITRLPPELCTMIIDGVIGSYKKPCWGVDDSSVKFQWRRLGGLLSACQYLRAVTKQRISETITFLGLKSGLSISLGLRMPDFVLKLIRHFRINLQLIVRLYFTRYHMELRPDC